MNRTIHFLGVPSSAAAHWPGQEKGPAALRAAGIVKRLVDHGATVVDRGDLPVVRWRSTRTPFEGHHVNNLEKTIAVAKRVSSEVSSALAEGGFPVAIGGDCTTTVGAFAGALKAGIDPALMYVDGGWDLSTPAVYPAGILDGMGTAHLLGAEGTTALRDIGPRFPMLAGDRFVQFGYALDDEEDEGELDRPLIEQFNLTGIPATAIQRRGGEAAREALADHLDDGQPFWLHFDVDVTDFFDLPVADVPVFTGGLAFADVVAAVGVFAADSRCIGITVTEFNPDHGDPDGREAVQLAESLASILAPTA